MALQLNQELQNKYPHLEISVLKYSDAMTDNDSKRIDSEFFKKEYLEKILALKKLNYQILQDIANVKGGKRLPLDENFTEDKNGVPYIRAEDNKNCFVEFFNSPKISLSLHNKLKNYQTNYNDILITIVGSIGDVGIVKFQLDKCNLTENCAKITNLTTLKPEVLFLFLLSKFGNLQISRECVGTAQPKLALERIRKFLIPLFPLEFQQQIEQMVRESHECLEQSKGLYCEAEVLLYRELGLDPENPLASIEPHSGSLNISVRPLSQSLNATGRLDSEYYQQKYDEIEKVIKKQKFAKLSDLVDMQKSIEPGSEAYQENGIPFIRVSNFNKFGISDTDIFLDFAEFSQTIKPKKETILLSKDGSIGIAYCVKDDGNFITSSALLHLNIKREKQREILPEYLTLILNSILVKLQSERDSGGSIIAHWRISEIEQILIPILDISIQEKIENLIKQSFTLRKKATELLQSAKNQVETAIIQAA